MTPFLYQLAGTLAGPGLRLWLDRRASAGKEDISRLGERWGRASRERPTGELIWIHAVSVGEMTTARPLIDRLLENEPGRSILWTTVTRSAADLAAANLPAGVVHQYLPLDTPPAVRRFLDHWRPEGAIFMESEFWPNLILAAKRRDIPLALVNGRMTERTAARWRRVPGLIGPVLRAFDVILAQSEPDAERLRSLGAARADVFDNLKYAAASLDADAEEFDALRMRLEGRPRWLAASTHDGEELLVGRVHRRLKKRHGNLLTIVAPRHPPRARAIVDTLRSLDLTVSQRSKGDPIEPETDIYIADTLGELGLFFRLAPIVFVGGSLVPHGGQNLLEPARLDCAILHGPHMDNFRDVARVFRQAGAAIEVGDSESLTVTIDQLLADDGMVSMRAANARRAAAAKADVLDRVVARLEPIFRGA